MTSPFRPVADGVTVRIRLQPRAGRTAVLGLAPDKTGAAVLKVAVTAAPEAGAANTALIGLLAATWRVPKSRIRLVQGATSRDKLLHLAAEDPAALAARLAGWAAGLSPA